MFFSVLTKNIKWNILTKNLITFKRLDGIKDPRDIEILGWCPAGPVLPHEEKVPLKPWLATLLVMVSQ